MERRWPSNTRAAEAFRNIKTTISKDSKPVDTTIPSTPSEKARWPLNTQAAHTARNIRNYLQIKRG